VSVFYFSNLLIFGIIFQFFELIYFGLFCFLGSF
jgi:hypothetical protein